MLGLSLSLSDGAQTSWSPGSRSGGVVLLCESGTSKGWYVTDEMARCGMKKSRSSKAEVCMRLSGLVCEDKLLTRAVKTAHSAHIVFSGAWLRQRPPDCRGQSEARLIHFCLVSDSDASAREGSPVAGQDSVEAADGEPPSDQTKTHPFCSDTLPSGFCALL